MTYSCLPLMYSILSAGQIVVAILFVIRSLQMGHNRNERSNYEDVLAHLSLHDSSGFATEKID